MERCKGTDLSLLKILLAVLCLFILKLQKKKKKEKRKKKKRGADYKYFSSPYFCKIIYASN